MSAAVELPSNGTYVIYAAVNVGDLSVGGVVVAEFRGNAVVFGLGVHVLTWTGVDLSFTYRLTTETQVSSGGGGQFTIVNPVVVM